MEIKGYYFRNFAINEIASKREKKRVYIYSEEEIVNFFNAGNLTASLKARNTFNSKELGICLPGDSKAGFAGVLCLDGLIVAICDLVSPEVFKERFAEYFIAT